MYIPAYNIWSGKKEVSWFIMSSLTGIVMIRGSYRVGLDIMNFIVFYIDGMK
jgi:hypothetical protein